MSQNNMTGATVMPQVNESVTNLETERVQGRGPEEEQVQEAVEKRQPAKPGNNSMSSTRKVVFIGILGGLSFVLMLINFALPFAPAFLKMDVAELPALFAGFFMGPLAGFEVIVVKLLLKLAIQGTETAFVGEFSNLVGSTAFVLTAALIYKKNRTKKGAILSMAVSTVVVSILQIFLNAYIMFPLYSRLYGMPMEAIVGMGTAINPRINSVPTLMLFSIFPFNLFKHVVTSLITFLVYKRVGMMLRKILYT